MEKFVMKFYPDRVFYFGLIIALIASCFSSSAGASYWLLVPVILGMSLVFLHMISLKFKLMKLLDELNEQPEKYIDEVEG